MQAISDILSGGYGRSRALARQGDARALDEVARQFEAYFLQQMLKSMRDASFGDPLLGSDDAKLYRDLFDRQLGLELAGGRGIGFADVLKRQLGHPVTGVSRPAGETSGLPSAVRPAIGPAAPALAGAGALASAARLHLALPVPGDEGARTEEVARAAPIGPASTDPPPHAGRATGAPRAARPEEPPFPSPEEFVTRLRPHAERAAAVLGVSPHLLLAQAALETGWGKHVLAGPGHRASSHNLFGIKADPRWDGPRVLRRTLEYDAGVMKRVDAPFRVYGSFAESFDDYARFIRDNPRYRDALEVRDNAEGYMRALQAAGYATDPGYADKVIGLLDRGPIRRARGASNRGI